MKGSGTKQWQLPALSTLANSHHHNNNWVVTTKTTCNDSNNSNNSNNKNNNNQLWGLPPSRCWRCWCSRPPCARPRTRSPTSPSTSWSSSRLRFWSNLGAGSVNLNKKTLTGIGQVDAVQPWTNHICLCSQKKSCSNATMGLRLQTSFLGEDGLQTSLPVTVPHLGKSKFRIYARKTPKMCRSHFASLLLGAIVLIGMKYEL